MVLSHRGRISLADRTYPYTFLPYYPYEVTLYIFIHHHFTNYVYSDDTSALLYERDSAVELCANEMENITHSSEGTLTRLYRNVMDAEYALGETPKDEISRKCRKQVELQWWKTYGVKQGLTRDEYKIPPSLWYRVANKCGYTLHKDENSIPVKTEKPPKHAPQTVRYDDINRRYTKAITNIMLSCQVFREWMNLVDVVQYTSEYNRDMLVIMSEAFKKNIQDLASKRKLIPENMQPLLLRTCHTVAGLDKILREFFIEANKIEMIHHKKSNGGKAFTSAELTKFFTANTPNAHTSIKPNNEYEAQFKGFHGQRCECGEYMMKRKDEHTLICISCRREASPKASIYCHSCQYRIMANVKKCPSCSIKIEIPNAVAL